MTARIDDLDVLQQWQLPKQPITARDAWLRLIERVSHDLDKTSQLALEHILTQGNLSERIVSACRGDYSRATLTSVYHSLSDCLLNNQPFWPL